MLENNKDNNYLNLSHYTARAFTSESPFDTDRVSSHSSSENSKKRQKSANFGRKSKI